MAKNNMEYGLDSLDLGASDHIRVNGFDELSASRFHDKVIKRAMIDPMSPIIVYIDSYGGSVDAMASMIETLESVPNKIITVCTGKAMSCGAVLLASGDYRYCGKHSRIMMHAISAGVGGDAYSIKESSNEITRLNEYWLEFFAKKCKIKDGYTEFKNMLNASPNRELFFDANDAKKFGIIDEIGIPYIRPLTLFHVVAIPQKPENNLDSDFFNMMKPCEKKTEENAKEEVKIKSEDKVKDAKRKNKVK